MDWTRITEISPSFLLTTSTQHLIKAEQFYDPLEDPTNQNALWTFKDKYMEEKQPRMIIFDTESTHLSKIRRVNHKKLIKEMSKPSNSNSYFPFQYMPQEKE